MSILIKRSCVQLKLLLALCVSTALFPSISHAQLCYGVTEAARQVLDIDPTSPPVTPGIAEADVIGVMAAGISNVEAIAWVPDGTGTILYAADAGDLGTINPFTGEFTLITAFGSGMNDVDSLHYDATTGLFWGVNRVGGSPNGPDQIFQIDLTPGPTFGTAIASTIVAVDSVTQPPLNTVVLNDVDDIAIDPVTGVFYGAMNNGSTNGVLVTINPATGATTVLGAFGVDDIEGMSFDPNGDLFGSTGTNAGAPANDGSELYSIALTGTATFIGNIVTSPSPPNNPYRDVESLACLVAVGTWSGTVTEDTTGDGNGNVPIPGVTIDLYYDANGDGILDPAELAAGPYQSTVTLADGSYQFTDLPPGYNYIAVETQSPGFGDVDEAEGGVDGDGGANAPDNNQIAGFVGNDEVDVMNNFVEGRADIEIEKTVYDGHDSGGSCASAVELVTGENGDNITYCFEVINTGALNLDNITLTDNTLVPPITRADMTLISGTEPLAPNASLVFYYQDTITGDLTNTASTSGNPVDGLGNDIPGIVDPTDDDTAQVEEVAPAIELLKQVYDGHDSGASCATAGELVTGVNGDNITYCFTVNNTGDTYLNNITLTDNTLAPPITRADMTLVSGSEPLAPGASLVLFYQDTIDGALTNTASTTGNPSEMDGTDIPGLDDPSDDDTAEVALAMLSIGNVVFADNGAGGGVANDGILNGGEVGIGGVDVELYAAGDIPGVDTPVATTTTAADGSYILTAPAGEYFVHIPASEFAAGGPLDANVSSTGQGAADNTDDDDVAEDGDDNTADGVSSGVYDLQPDSEPTGETGFVGSTVSPSDDANTNSTADFGFYEPVSIGNVIFSDDGAGGGVSNDGILNGGEVGIAGVEVELYAAGATPGVDAPIATEVTAADGSYIFDSVAPGEYFVHIPASEFAAGEPLESNVSSTGQGAADNADDDNVGEDGDDNESDGVSSGVFDVQAGSEPTGEAGFNGTSVSTQDDDNTNSTVDFGFYEPIAVGNVIFADNGTGGGVADDGILNGGEVGIGGVAVELYAAGDTPGVDTPIDTTTTAPDGSYILTGPPGEYFVHIPASEFAAGGPLEDSQSSTGQGAPDNADDDNIGEDGDDNEADGVSSGVLDLQPNTEPTGETGFPGSAVSPVDDNDTNSTVDFGFVEPVSIGNVIFSDDGAGGGVANDGILNGGEAGIAGVAVELYAAGDTPGVDTPVATTTTAADGSYVLTAAPGEYFVHIPASEFAAGGPLDANVSSTGQGGADNADDDNVGEDGDDNEVDGVSTGVYDLQPNAEPTGEAGFGGLTVPTTDDDNTNSTADFGFYEPVAIGNVVFADNGAGGGTVNNGILDGGETGISGVVVELYAAGDTPGVDTPVDTTATAADGSYILTGPPGEYFVHIPASEFGPGEPLESNASSVGQGGADNTDDDNAGEDGDDNESDGVSSPVYDLQPGTEPAGELGFPGSTVSPVDDDNTNSTVDFAFVVPVSMGSLVWIDSNGDGIQQPNEPPLPGATVTLLVDNGAGFVAANDVAGNPVAPIVTGPDGIYVFDELPEGTYKVQVTPPAGYFVIQASQNAANDDDTEDDSNIASEPVPGTFESGEFTLTAGAEPAESGANRGDTEDSTGGSIADLNGNMTIDFGFVEPASIGNYVWLDFDMDGVQDANEDGIAGVEVILTPPAGVDIGAGPGNPITTTTGPNGEYLFSDLPPANGYVVTVNPATIPTGLVQTYDEGPTGTTGVLDNSSDPIDLSPNEEHLTADFGYGTPAGVGSLGDTIWVDANDDGVQDPGEPGIPGVTVTLTPPPDVDPDGAGPAGPGDSITVVTDNNGNYLFTGLPLDETYIVEVDTTTLPSGYVSGPSNLGDPDVRDGNSTTADDQTLVVLTTADPVNLDADFGYLPPADQNNSIGNVIWIDADEDGNGPAGAGDGSDVGEQVVPGVTVSLIDLATNAVIATTITDANGEYEFTGIPDGNYEVVVTDQNNVLAGLVPTADADGIGTPDVSVVDLDSGSTDPNPVDNVDQDFGYVEPNSSGGSGVIGDTIFFDEDGSGVPDAGEGLEGVVVELYGPGPDGIIGNGDDVLLATTTTDENGNYLFTGLDTSDTGPNPGTDYQVVVDPSTLPNGGTGWSNTVDPDTAGTGDNESVTTLTNAAPSDLDQDFGYTSDDDNTIMGTVWVDSDGNGVQDESGEFEGVTIELLDENGNVIATTVTDVDGNYEFTGLPDGIYMVVVTDDNNVLGGFEHTDSPNGTSDTSDETSKDDTGYVVDLDSGGTSDTPVTDETGDFGYEPSITNPISLGSFLASAGEDGTVLIEWSTQTEVANLGFNLYGQLDGEWVLLNDSLVIGQGDAVSVQSYELVVETEASVFALSDFDITGKETLHGPFRLGELSGVVSDRQVIDWDAERAEREAKDAKREARRKAQQEQRSLKRKQRRLKQQNQETSMFKQLLNNAAAVVLSALVPAAHASTPETLVNLTTTESGIYEISVGSLALEGVDIVGESASELALINQGSPVAIQVIGADPLDADSRIRFIATPMDTLYTDTNVYTLSLDAGSAVRMQVDVRAASGNAATSYLKQHRVERQAKYSFTSPDGDDPWYAAKIVAIGKPASEVVRVDLKNVAVGGNTGGTKPKLKVRAWGGIDQPGVAKDHNMQVKFNGREVASKQFDGLKAAEVESELDTVVEGLNTVTVTLPMDTGYAFDAVNLDEVVVDYPSQFVAEDARIEYTSTFGKFNIRGFSKEELPNDAADLVVMRQDQAGTHVMTGTQGVCRVSGCLMQVPGTGALAKYYVASANELPEPGVSALPLEDDIISGNANYLIISHPDFIGSAGNYHLDNLKTELESEMGTVDIVDVESIYAQFGHHLFDPQAIRDYISYSHANRGTSYVLLVGGDVYDYRQFENEDATSFIPSIYAATGNNITFAPVDAKYVDLDDDNVPDLPIARLPVRTASQLGILVNKRNDYVNRSYTGKVLLVADDYDEVQQYDFGDDADEVEADYLSNFQIEKAYVDDLGTSAARTKVRNEINQGVTMTAFFGHSSTNQWSFDGLFTGPDAAGLQNQGKPTVVTQWGCWNAYYVSPNEDSMGHRFMMEGDRGAIAVMGASTLTDANSERKLARLVFERIANGERLGDAVTNAKQAYAQENPNDLDVLLGWTVLGLPELIIN